MKKPLVATIVFNSTKITNDCFLKSLYKTSDEKDFDLLIVSTSDNDFILNEKYKNIKNIKILNFKKQYSITTHAMAIQKILDISKLNYDDIIICENDTIIKQNLLKIIDKNFNFIGQDSNNTNHKHWWTRLYSKLHFGCQRYLPILMYFNVNSFENREIIYEKNDCNLCIKIPTLKIDFNLKNTWLCDPGWYFMIWAQNNKIKCKEINIDEYISHFWYGSENRNSQLKIPYNERLEKFIQSNLKYL